MIRITPAIAIGEEEIEMQFVRASGPGGQNVNKVATAVQLRFDAAHSPALSAEVRERLAHLAGKRMSKDGVLIIDARRFRTQEQNRKDALDRLINLVRQATQRPKPRKKTRPTAASIERRLESKHRRGKTKLQRRGKPEID